MLRRQTPLIPMMICRSLLLLFAALTARAQLTLLAVNGTTESPVGSTYQAGTVAAGDSRDFRFRARNTGAAPVTVSKIAISGSGFSIAQTPSPPFVIAGGTFQDLYVH